MQQVSRCWTTVIIIAEVSRLQPWKYRIQNIFSVEKIDVKVYVFVTRLSRFSLLDRDLDARRSTRIRVLEWLRPGPALITIHCVVGNLS